MRRFWSQFRAILWQLSIKEAEQTLPDFGEKDEKLKKLKKFLILTFFAISQIKQ